MDKDAAIKPATTATIAPTRSYTPPTTAPPSILIAGVFMTFSVSRVKPLTLYCRQMEESSPATERPSDSSLHNFMASRIVGSLWTALENSLLAQYRPIALVVESNVEYSPLRHSSRRGMTAFSQIKSVTLPHTLSASEGISALIKATNLRFVNSSTARLKSADWSTLLAAMAKPFEIVLVASPASRKLICLSCLPPEPTILPISLPSQDVRFLVSSSGAR